MRFLSKKRVNSRAVLARDVRTVNSRRKINITYVSLTIEEMCKQHNEDRHHGKENERTRKIGQNERQRKATDENLEKRKGEETRKRSITAPPSPSLNVKTPS